MYILVFEEKDGSVEGTSPFYIQSHLKITCRHLQISTSLWISNWTCLVFGLCIFVKVVYYLWFNFVRKTLVYSRSTTNSVIDGRYLLTDVDCYCWAYICWSTAWSSIDCRIKCRIINQLYDQLYDQLHDNWSIGKSSAWSMIKPMINYKINCMIFDNQMINSMIKYVIIDAWKIFAIVDGNKFHVTNTWRHSVDLTSPTRNGVSQLILPFQQLPILCRCFNCVGSGVCYHCSFIYLCIKCSDIYISMHRMFRHLYPYKWQNVYLFICTPIFPTIILHMHEELKMFICLYAYKCSHINMHTDVHMFICIQMFSH